MSQKAQAGLEYLMTYGWALVIIASVVGVLVFIINPTSTTASFSSSDPTKIMLKGSSITENTASLVLQNITGGAIKINSVHFFGDLGAGSNWALNHILTIDFPTEIATGSEILFENLVSQNNCTGGGTVVIFYSGVGGLSQRADIACNGGAKMPVAWYRFDESSGEIASDSSGNGNNGILKPDYPSNAPTHETSCPSESCLQFDGIDDYIEVADSSILDISADLAISVWVYPTSAVLTYYRPIVAKYYTVGERAYQINVDEGYSAYLGQGTFQFWISSDGTIKDHVEAPALPNIWQHIVAVHKDSKMSIYVNGALKESKDTAISSINLTDKPLIVGTNSNAARFFQGLNDDVKIYNRALSDFEVCRLCHEHAGAVSVSCNC